MHSVGMCTYFIGMFSDIKGEVFVLLMNHKCCTLQPVPIFELIAFD